MDNEVHETQSGRPPVEQPKPQWQHYNGKNEKHIKPANADYLYVAIANAQKTIADLKATGGPKSEKKYWSNQIKHFRRQLENRGTEDTRVGKNQYQRSF